MSTIKYLLDENVDPLFRSGLLKREPTMVVLRVGSSPNAPRHGTLDPEILCWCEEHDFILITNNRKSMPVHLHDHLVEGRHIPGILQLNPKMSIRETIEELWIVWALSEEDEYGDRIAYLPVS
jgi:hypothetical protein